MSKKIFIATALTDVPVDECKMHLKFIEDLSELLSTKDFFVRSAQSMRREPDFRGFDDSRGCYLVYKKAIESSSFFIADVTYPSIGVGIELQIADFYDIPLIILIKEKNEIIENRCLRGVDNFLVGSGGVSAMLEGLKNIRSIIQYSLLEDVADRILRELK